MKSSIKKLGDENRVNNGPEFCSIIIVRPEILLYNNSVYLLLDFNFQIITTRWAFKIIISSIVIRFARIAGYI